MAFSDFLLSVQKQLACLCARTDPDGTALADLPVTLDSEKLTVTDLEKIAGVAPQMDDTDKVAVSLYGKGTAAGDKELKTTTPADGLTPDAGSLEVLAHLGLFNGTTWDRQRNNSEVTLLASAVRSSNTASPDQVNYNARGVIVFFNVSVVPGTDTVQLVVQLKDPVAGTYATLVTSTATAAIAHLLMVVYPGIVDTPATLDKIAEVPLPLTWRTLSLHSAASDFTYSVSAAYIL